MRCNLGRNSVYLVAAFKSPRGHNMNLQHYNSYIRIDLAKIESNIRKIKAHIGDGCGIIPVVKSDAYGLGTVEIARTLAKCGIELIANSHLSESIAIRENNINVDLMILGALPPHAVKYAVEYDVQLTVFNIETAQIFSDECKIAGKTGKVHVKIETGLGRIGARPGQDLEILLDKIEELGNLEIVGVFTHFATADMVESEFAYAQLAEFERGLAQLSARGICPKYIHTANTGAAVWFEKSRCTHVRCGFLFLGYSNIVGRQNPVGVQEPATWRAFITNIKEVLPGQSVGYDRHFAPQKPTMVATVDVGYGDGVNRALALNGGPVIVGGVRTRYLGVCMDQCFVDVTGIDCKIFDEVTLLGGDGGECLSLFELADFAGQNAHSMLTALSPAVLRVYE